MNNKYCISFVAVIILFFFLFQCPPVVGGEVDILIDKLVEKGVLSEDDAREIVREVKEAAEHERAEVVRETRQALINDGATILDGLPKWLHKTTMKGDLRLRYQYTDKDGRADRHRGRYRLRVGFSTEVTDAITVGFGLATGGSDPRSTNQTMGNSFESPDIRLDYAYASYKPVPWLKLVGGKFKNPLWRPSDLLWDTDIRPEGISALLEYEPSSSVQLFCNAGYWILDERSRDENDPVMYVVQPGVKLKMGDSVYLKTAAAIYQFENVENSLLDHSAETNSLDNGVLDHDYDAIGMSGEIGVKNPAGIVPFASLFGDYVNNRDVSRHDDGYLIGITFGDKKVSHARQWKVKALYRRLERDAWLDIFPDSDAFGGETNTKGYECIVTYGLCDNVSLSLDYYQMRRIEGKSESENLLQADLNLKF